MRLETREGARAGGRQAHCGHGVRVRQHEDARAVVSIGTFWLGYRQTIGVRQERIRNADREIESSLLKRIALQNFTPDFSDIERAISGMAVIARVPVTALRSADNVINLLLMRVLQNDLIDDNHRARIIGLLRDLSSKGRVQNEGTSSGEKAGSSRRIQNTWTLPIIAVLTLLSASIGTLVFILTSKNEFASSSSLIYFFVALLVVVATAAGVIAWRPPSSRNFGVAGDIERAKKMKTYPAEKDVRDAMSTITKLTPWPTHYGRVPRDAPERPSTANDRHQQHPANLKLARALDPRATHRDTLVMRSSAHSPVG